MKYRVIQIINLRENRERERKKKKDYLGGYENINKMFSKMNEKVYLVKPRYLVVLFVEIQ